MYFFTADEHYGHVNILKYDNRPWDNIHDMNHALITNHNQIVSNGDIVVHAGDFTLGKEDYAEDIIRQLNGQHIFLYGSHDYWIKKSKRVHRWTKTINGEYIVVDHYAMRTWPRSHYGSWQLHGHSHGGLTPIGKQIDIGIMNNTWYPYAFRQIVDIMSIRKETPLDNLRRRRI